MTKTQKTWKREVAFLMFAHIVYLSIVGSVAILEILVGPYMLFMLGAYGLDSILKQSSFSFVRKEDASTTINK